ncbi:ca2+ sensor protein [Sphingomonas sp. JC676]|uniref:EF-hand domain-containing protein n=1 Tax=Sphingomonas sp. JC676 TaxID=2768065 RepID=UPI0016579D63|nr:ca2+ sensor protein [Sphingomonas sp. JC676]MBC9031506.1 ca2+ sensor protein [Sphingomonas sp. JC676]
MKQLIPAAALCATLVAGSALAAQDHQRRDPLARADANGDGIVTREEMLADVDARFAKLDANKDGKVTADERKVFAEGTRPRMMGRTDANGDGAVTLEEQRAQANKRFDRIDTNHDGKIDQSERDAVMQRMMSMRGGHDQAMPAPGSAPQTPPADPPSAPDGN